MSHILSIATETGPYAYDSQHLLAFLQQRVGSVAARKLGFLSNGSQIERRHSVLPDFDPTREAHLFKDPATDPSTAERMAVYDREAIVLAESAARKALAEAQLRPEQVHAVIAVTCTGHQAPGMEIALTRRLGLSDSVQRHGVNFMGCYAAFHGLRLADLICQQQSDAHVLVVCVELCSIHFRKDEGDDNLLSTSLFADGAAAVVMSAKARPSQSLGEVMRFDSALIKDSEDAMGWKIGDAGFEMILSREVPAHLKQSIKAEYDHILTRAVLPSDAVSHFAIHPGGVNILHAFQHALDLPDAALHHSHAVLREYGNMSSPSVLFVLDRVIRGAENGAVIYSAAFGPGLTVESALIKR